MNQKSAYAFGSRLGMIKAALTMEDMLTFAPSRRALVEYGLVAPTGAKLNAPLVRPTAAALAKFAPRHQMLTEAIRARQAAGKPLAEVQKMYADLMATPVRGGRAMFTAPYGGPAVAPKLGPAAATIRTASRGAGLFSKLRKFPFKKAIPGAAVAGILGLNLLARHLQSRQARKSV